MSTPTTSSEILVEFFGVPYADTVFVGDKSFEVCPDCKEHIPSGPRSKKYAAHWMKVHATDAERAIVASWK